jgi:hypothetical protein
MVSWVFLRSVPYIRKIFTFGEHPIQNVCYQLRNTIRGRFYTGLGSDNVVFCWSSHYLSWLNYCQGVCWQEGWTISCVPWSKRYFPTKMQFSKTIMRPFTQLELLSNEECRRLGCYALSLLLKPIFFGGTYRLHHQGGKNQRATNVSSN